MSLEFPILHGFHAARAQRVSPFLELSHRLSPHILLVRPVNGGSAKICNGDRLLGLESEIRALVPLSGEIAERRQFRPAIHKED